MVHINVCEFKDYLVDVEPKTRYGFTLSSHYREACRTTFSDLDSVRELFNKENKWELLKFLKDFYEYFYNEIEWDQGFILCGEFIPVAKVEPDEEEDE